MGAYIRPFGRRAFGKQAAYQEIACALILALTLLGIVWRFIR
jgi:hypothetical protein